MKADCYAKLRGEIVGPLTTDALKELADNGQITPTTLIRRGENGEWIEARRINGLAQFWNCSYEDAGPSTGLGPAAPEIAASVLDGRACPFCGEQIKVAAKKCRHCGAMVDASLRAAGELPHKLTRKPNTTRTNRYLWVTGGVCLGTFLMCAGLCSGLLTQTQYPNSSVRLPQQHQHSHDVPQTTRTSADRINHIIANGDGYTWRGLTTNDKLLCGNRLAELSGRHNGIYFANMLEEFYSENDRLLRSRKISEIAALGAVLNLPE